MNVNECSSMASQGCVLSAARSDQAFDSTGTRNLVCRSAFRLADAIHTLVRNGTSFVDLRSDWPTPFTHWSEAEPRLLISILIG